MKLVAIDNVVLPDWGWHQSSSEEDAKLSSSLHRYGQLQPLLVREVGESELEGFEVVDGRRRLNIMKQAAIYVGDPESREVWVHSIGRVSKASAVKLAMALELKAPINYAKLAAEVQALKEDDDFLSFPMFTPWSAERIRYFEALLRFDWSQFGTEDEQSEFFADDETPDHWSVVAPPVIVVPAQPKSPSSRPLLPAVATLSAEERNAARAAAIAAPAPVVPDVTPDAPVDIAAFRNYPQSTILVGENYSVPQDMDWRPEAPPCLDGITDIELDCESTGLRWWAGDKMVGMSIRYGDKTQYLPYAHQAGGNLDEAVLKRWAQRELRGKKIRNINSRFDNHLIYGWGVDLEEQGCVWEDVAHYAALLDEYRKEFSLAALASDFLGEAKTGENLDKSRMGEYHAGQVAAYACQDVDLVARLNTVMQPLMIEQGLEKVRDLESAVIYPVCEMECNAAHIDRAALREAVTTSARMLQEILFEIAGGVGFEMNPDAPADWARLFQHYKLPIPGRTAPSKSHPKGQASFTDALLEKVDHPIVQLARRAGKLASIRSKFLLPYAKVVGEDCKLRFALHQLRGDEYGTIRGRFSMSGAGKLIGQFGANLQQAMRVNSQREAFGFKYDDSSHDEEIFLVRSFFIPETGDYLSADAQSIEYRLAAHFAKSERLIEAYKADTAKLEIGDLTSGWVDFHGVVGDTIRPYKDLNRNIIKNFNFGQVYGSGYDTSAATVGMPRSESDPIVDLWRRTFPEFRTLIRKAQSIAEKRGFVRTILGRRARFPDHSFTHAAINYVIQGSAADVMKTKLVELHRARKWTGFLLRQTVHDEADGDATTPETARRVSAVLNRQSFKLRVPIVWEVETGKNWAEAH